MSPLAILIISIVLINTAGKVILACIDAKNNSKTRERTSNAKRIKHHETEEKAISDK